MLSDSKFHDYLLFAFIAVVLGCTLTTSSFFINKLYSNNVYNPKIELGSIKGLKDNASDIGVKESIIVESGSVLPEINEYFTSSNIKIDNANIHYFNNNTELTVDDISYLENGIRYTSGVFDLRVVIQLNNKTYNTYLYIQDQTVPKFILTDLSYTGGIFFPESFVDSYEDNSRSSVYTVSMNPSFDDVIEKNGNHRIEVTVCDSNSNCDVGYAYLNVNIPEGEVEKNKKNNSGNKPKQNKPNGSGSGSGGNGGNSGSSGSGGNGGNSGSGGNGGTTSNPPGGETHDITTPPSAPVETPCEMPPVYEVDSSKTVTKTEKSYELVCTYTKYNAVIKKYGDVTYVYYDDGTKAITKLENFDYSIVANTFSASVSDMKPEAVSLYNSLGNTRSTVISKTNAYRTESGLVNLVEDQNLSIMATIRAIEIAYANKFSHTRPNGSSWTTLFTEYGYKQGVVNGWMNKGENLAYGYNDDAAAVLGWRNSPEHYQNMVTPEFRKIGVGKYTLNGKVYTVQLFST